MEDSEKDVEEKETQGEEVCKVKACGMEWA